MGDGRIYMWKRFLIWFLNVKSINDDTKIFFVSFGRHKMFKFNIKAHEPYAGYRHIWIVPVCILIANFILCYPVHVYFAAIKILIHKYLWNIICLISTFHLSLIDWSASNTLYSLRYPQFAQFVIRSKFMLYLL